MDEGEEKSLVRHRSAVDLSKVCVCACMRVFVCGAGDSRKGVNTRSFTLIAAKHKIAHTGFSIWSHFRICFVINYVAFQNRTLTFLLQMTESLCI